MIIFNFRKGFTLVELMVSLAIFAFMTAFLVAKYSNFNQGILLTNLAYDVALTLRNAQSYGLNVKSKPEGGASYSTNFDYPYGVHFDKRDTKEGTNEPVLSNTQMIFFADLDYAAYGGKVLSPSDSIISTYNIKGGSHVSDVCVGTSENSCDSMRVLDISFMRPNPNAIITADSQNITYPYAMITVQSSSGLTKKIVVRSTGQISVK